MANMLTASAGSQQLIRVASANKLSAGCGTIECQRCSRLDLLTGASYLVCLPTRWTVSFALTETIDYVAYENQGECNGVSCADHAAWGASSGAGQTGGVSCTPDISSLARGELEELALTYQTCADFPECSRDETLHNFSRWIVEVTSPVVYGGNLYVAMFSGFKQLRRLPCSSASCGPDGQTLVECRRWVITDAGFASSGIVIPGAPLSAPIWVNLGPIITSCTPPNCNNVDYSGSVLGESISDNGCGDPYGWRGSFTIRAG